MFCKKCGAEMPDKAVICPYCGFDVHGPSIRTMNNSGVQTPMVQGPPVQSPYPQQQGPYVQPPQPYQQPVQQYVAPPAYVTPMQQAEANSVLIWGILGLAFACTFWLSFLGIVFSAVARGKVNGYISRYGILYGKAKVGNILSRIGLPVAIVLTVFAVIYAIYMFAAFGTLFYYYG